MEMCALISHRNNKVFPHYHRVEQGHYEFTNHQLGEQYPTYWELPWQLTVVEEVLYHYPHISSADS